MSVATYLSSAEQAERRAGAPRASLSVPVEPGTDVDALVARLAGRHELLRSTICDGTDGRTVQRVLDGVTPDLAADVVDTRLTLTLPSRYTDLGGLAALAADLTALLRGEEPPEPVQASQYAAWQADSGAGGAPVTLPPPGRQRPAITTEPTVHRRTVDAGPLAHDLGLAVEDVLLAAWLLCVWRFGGDHTCGVYVDDRTRFPDLATMAGVCSRYLPLLATFDPHEPAEAALRRVAEERRALAELAPAFRWRDVPPGTYDCDARSPDAPVLFAYVEAADGVRLRDPSHDPGLSLTALRGESTRVEIVGPAPLADAYLALLGDLAAAPGRAVGELALLPPAAERRMRTQFGHAPEPAPEVTADAYALFAAQARRTPGRVAVADRTRSYTYAELDARAGAVASALATYGVEPGDRVALLLGRGVDLVAGVLGTWRAGAAYVPLTTDLPGERMAFMLADSGSRVVLADLPVPPEVATDVIELATVADGGNAGAGPGDVAAAAYVIYTSGTTGRPKGVVVEHRSVVNLALAHRERIYRRHDPELAGLRASLTASIAFDGAVERISLLLSGHTLFVVDDETRRDPAAYVAFAREHRLDVLDLTPSFLALLVQAGLLDGPGPVAALVGGEAISPPLWRDLAASAVTFYNVYGPTETTVNAAVGPVTGVTPHLGPALPGVRVYVLDPALRPVPVGAPGEIHVAGAGVARGYLNRPDLTAAKFVDNPWADADPSFARLYRTGDLGRFRPDGTIEFLGRADGQVKVRGYRVETEEIADVLREDRDVADALVVLNARGALVGYVAAPAVPGLLERLGKALAARLPDYMIPSAVVVVERFPLTANGKVDVAALPEPGTQRPSTLSTTYVAPEGETEKAIALIWEQLLDRSGIGSHDNFFELGGDSLLAVEMITRVNDELGVDLLLAAVFLDPSVAELAAAVARELAA